ncbi:MAG: hypothetical protein ABI266_07150 [Ginsengibacter sp.]
MKYCLKFCFVFLMIVPSLLSKGQEKSVITTVKKFKPPVVQTTWGNSKSDAKVTKDEAVKMLSLPIKIIDSSGRNYTIDNYRFLYRSKSLVENEQTGQKEVSFTVTSDKFVTSPISKIWIDNIVNGLQSDEQFFLFDVMVKDDKGRLFFAPDLKITIQ